MITTIAVDSFIFGDMIRSTEFSVLIPERIKEKTRKFALLFNYDRSSTSKYPKRHASIRNWKEQKRFECQVGVALSQHAYGSHPSWIGVTGLSTTKSESWKYHRHLNVCKFCCTLFG